MVKSSLLRKIVLKISYLDRVSSKIFRIKTILKYFSLINPRKYKLEYII